AAAPPPPVVPPDPFAALETELTCGDSTAEVRLTGTRPAPWGSSYGWLENARPRPSTATGVVAAPRGPSSGRPATARPPPPTATAVVAGVRDGRRLWIDLAMAPDALTVGGD